MPSYNGTKLCIEWGKIADETFDEALSKIPGGRRDSAKAQLQALIERLANTGRLRSPDQFMNEGDGFYAIKTKVGLRAYGWYASKRADKPIKGVFAISHFILKKRGKLDPKDKRRMIESRRKYEQYGIDC